MQNMLTGDDRRPRKSQATDQSRQLSGALRVRNRHYDLGENSHWGARRSSEGNRTDRETSKAMKDQMDLLEV